jgi:5-formyltetrahydrofolate cyclo-ligase
MNAKAVLRETVRGAVRLLSPADRESASIRLCQRLRQQAIWQDSRSILLFASLADEPDVTSLIADALSLGKEVTLPRFDSARGVYEPAAIASMADLRTGRFGAREPGAGCPSIYLNQLDFILVPGIAFDLAGRRLGRGKGYYDRLLAQVRGHKCGAGFDAQVVAELPEEPHDVRVDSILTPTRWHLVSTGGLK